MSSHCRHRRRHRYSCRWCRIYRRCRHPLAQQFVDSILFVQQILQHHRYLPHNSHCHNFYSDIESPLYNNRHYSSRCRMRHRYSRWQDPQPLGRLLYTYHSIHCRVHQNRHKDRHNRSLSMPHFDIGNHCYNNHLL